MKLPEINNKWFFSEPNGLLRIILVFIKGDVIILLPLFVLIIITGFIHLKLGLIALGLYVSLRFLGEMIYWLLQQFGPKTYRPFDFGFKQLDNNAIYILYQLIGLAWIVIGLTFIIGVLLYL